MTITVEAGIRIAKLQEILRAEGQRLPIDVPRAADATLGGAIATNTSGPRRYGYGTFRDYVIGISVVDAAGNETKAGGRVVKNVAGYDLCKLYTGSLGTLGIITQVTLKLKPLPEESSLVALKFKELPAAGAAIDRLSTSRTRPVAIELLNSTVAEIVAGKVGERLQAPPNIRLPWILIVGFEEGAEAVRWQENQLIQETAEFHPWSAGFDEQPAQRLWELLVEFQSVQLCPVAFKANFRSSRSAEFMAAASREPVAWSVQAHAGNGIAFGHAPADSPREQVIASLGTLRSLAVSFGGNLVVRRCPTDLKRELPVWGEPRSDHWLMKAIKHKIDPTEFLNPGRFV